MARLTQQIKDFREASQVTAKATLTASGKGQATVQVGGKTVQAQIVTGGDRPGNLQLVKGQDDRWYGFGEAGKATSNTTLRHYRRRAIEDAKAEPNIPVLFVTRNSDRPNEIKLYIGGAHPPVLLETYSRVGFFTTEAPNLVVVHNFPVVFVLRTTIYNYDGSFGRRTFSVGPLTVTTAIGDQTATTGENHISGVLPVGTHQQQGTNEGDVIDATDVVAERPISGYVSTFGKQRFVFFSFHQDGANFGDYWIGNMTGQYQKLSLASLSGNDWRRHRATTFGGFELLPSGLKGIASGHRCTDVWTEDRHANLPGRGETLFYNVEYTGTSATFEQVPAVNGANCVLDDARQKTIRVPRVYRLQNTDILAPGDEITVLGSAPNLGK